MEDCHLYTFVDHILIEILFLVQLISYKYLNCYFMGIFVMNFDGLCYCMC
jgi:hypothetical protein